MGGASARDDPGAALLDFVVVGLPVLAIRYIRPDVVVVAFFDCVVVVLLLGSEEDAASFLVHVRLIQAAGPVQRHRIAGELDLVVELRPIRDAAADRGEQAQEAQPEAGDDDGDPHCHGRRGVDGSPRASARPLPTLIKGARFTRYTRAVVEVGTIEAFFGTMVKMPELSAMSIERDQ